MWSMQDNYACVLSVPAHNYAIYSIAFGHGICASASRDKTIKIWDELSFNPIQRLDTKSGGHSHSVNKLLFQHDHLISCSDDRQIICWKQEG
jgi:centriolar protein POC1